MRKILALFIVLFPLLTSAQSVTDQIMRKVYGSRITTCIKDSNADLFSTTVDQDSASGQTSLYVAATTDLAAGDLVVADSDNAHSKLEVCIVSSVSAGDHVVCTANLTYSHTAAQADKVTLSNRLPATGTTGFTAGRMIFVTCHDTSGVGVSCNCIQGGIAISAVQGDAAVESKWLGEELFAGEKAAWMVQGQAPFVSCVPRADDAIIQVCYQD